jgi:hypothetical protein
MVFASQDNVQMLWELLLDNLQGNNQQINIQNLQSTFLNNVKMFNEKEQFNITPANLVAANKHFLKNMVGLINRQSQETIQNQQNLTYLAKDIQAQRQNQFDLQLEQKRQEFNNYNVVKKPPVPNFADNIDLENEKLNATSIKQIIDQTVAQRNYETDTNFINNNNNNNKSNIFDKINNNINKKPAFKQIKIDNEDLSNNIIENSIVDLDNKKKQVSWLDNIETDQHQYEEQDQDENINLTINEKPFNILDKLKKVVNNTDNINNSSINNNTDINLKIDNLNNKINELTNKLDLIYNLLINNSNNNNNTNIDNANIDN